MSKWLRSNILDIITIMQEDNVSLTKAGVPAFLRRSAFLQGWEDSGDLVSISRSVLKEDDLVSNIEDLHHLLNTLRFWIVDDIPDTIFDFALGDRSSTCRETLLEFETDFTFIATLLDLMEEDDTKYWMTALCNTDLACLKYLFARGFISNHDISCAVAAVQGSVDCLAYLHQKNFPWDEHVCVCAATHGHSCPRGVETCEQAATAGQAECLMFAITRGCTWSKQTVYNVAAHGHIHIFKEFPQLKTRAWFGEVAGFAAKYGQLDLLKYLYSVQCSWSVHATMFAARYGHMECLRYLHEQQCPWDTSTPRMAALYGQLHCLRYALENGCACDRGAFYVADTDEIRTYLMDTMGYTE